MGGGVGFFCGASTRLPTSDFLSPISRLLGSLAAWLLVQYPTLVTIADLAPWQGAAFSLDVPGVETPV
jgi:hypothetical protein